MFTGIIEALGKLSVINVTSAGARVTIQSDSLDMSDVNLGDSIATNGVCLTVVEFGAHHFSADVSNETLKRVLALRYIKLVKRLTLKKPCYRPHALVGTSFQVMLMR